MFILTIIAQPGIFLDTSSQLASANLDETGFDYRQLEDFKVPLSCIPKEENCLSDRHY